MKHNYIIKSVHVTVIILLSLHSMGQVADIGQVFTKRGFVQNVDFDDSLILVNFVAKLDKNKNEIVYEKEIESHVLTLSKTVFLNSNKDTISVSEIKSGNEIFVDGEFFETKNNSNATLIKVVKPKIYEVKEGRIDFIKNDMVYADGQKFKLKENKLIKGKKNTGYGNKTFSAVTQLKLGDYASVSGKYYDSGFCITDEFIIYPETKTEFDELADSFDYDTYNSLYPTWSNEVSREKLLGKTIPLAGKIYSNKIVQNYVNRVGQLLVPIQFQNKIKFIFIVLDRSEVFANARANGLVYVSVGLLKNLENEAQLAAVLGHEIAHTIYEHTAHQIEDNYKNKKNNISFTKLKNLFNNSTEELDDVENQEINVISDLLKGLTPDSSMQSAVEAYLNNLLSKYSIDDELQADRVGLSLMAMAGYDPREAPVVWKNIYNSYGKFVPKDQIISYGKFVFDKVTADNGKKVVKSSEKVKVEDKTKELAGKGFQTFVEWKIGDYTNKSRRTHPDEVKRFEELNRIVSYYWIDPTILTNAKNGAGEYLIILKQIFADEKPISKPKKKK